MTKQKNQAVDKEQYKHYLIDEVETLRKENDTLKRKLNILQTKYETLIEIQEAEDCYTCLCGKVTECNCKHLGYLKQHLIDVEKLNTLWID